MSAKSLPPISQEEITHINVYGAKVHNLKNVDVHIPRNQFVVVHTRVGFSAAWNDRT